MKTIKSYDYLLKCINTVIPSIDEILVNLDKYFEISKAFDDNNDIIKKAPILFTQAFDNLKYKIIVLSMKLFEEINEETSLENILNETKSIKEYYLVLKELVNSCKKMLKSVLPKGYLSGVKHDKAIDEKKVLNPYLLKYENINFNDLKNNLLSIYDILNNIKEKCK